MNIEEKILNSKLLEKKIEFITIQSSEQSEEEIRYKNVNRKQIRFDLSDLRLMSSLGELLSPSSISEHLENLLSNSRMTIFRLIGEKRVAKRGMRFIRSLFLKHPEKFSSVEYSSNKSPRMKLIHGTFVISEQVNQKTISLKNEKEDYQSELQSFRNRFKEEEARLRQQESLIKQLTAEDYEERKLLGASA